jgi:septal ring factor EnvC (AmiA/AmiB activator)
MKKLLPIIIIFCLASSAMAWPWSKREKKEVPAVKPVATKVVKTNSKTSIQEAREVIQELNSELTSAKNENAKLKNNLVNANKKIKEAESSLINVQKQADLLKEWGIQKQQEAFQWLEKYNNAIKRYHRLKWIAALIAAAGGVFLGLQFMAFVPPPYNLLVPIGGAGLFGILVWLFL